MKIIIRTNTQGIIIDGDTRRLPTLTNPSLLIFGTLNRAEPNYTTIVLPEAVRIEGPMICTKLCFGQFCYHKMLLVHTQYSSYEIYYGDTLPIKTKVKKEIEKTKIKKGIGKFKAIFDRQRNYLASFNFVMISYLFINKVGWSSWYLLGIPFWLCFVSL